MNAITIYHNPACSTSRKTLALIRNSGDEPTIIDYLQTPPSKSRLLELLRDMGMQARALLDFMLAHPILINRPIVVTPLATRLCRPSETVLEILPSAQKEEFKSPA